MPGQHPDEVICGACLCGAVTFELKASFQYGPDRAMGICYCLGCQRWTGGPSLPFVVVVPERFRVTRGQEQVAHYRDEASTVRAFCRRCGSGLYQDIGTAYYVSAGALRGVMVRPGFCLYDATESQRGARP